MGVPQFGGNTKTGLLLNNVSQNNGGISGTTHGIATKLYVEMIQGSVTGIYRIQLYDSTAGVWYPFVNFYLEADTPYFVNSTFIGPAAPANDTVQLWNASTSVGNLTLYGVADLG